MLKICTNCNLEKTTNDFSIRKASKDGLEYCCKSCRKTKSKNYYIENKVELINKSMNYNYKNYEKHKQRQKVYAAKNRHKIRKYETFKRKTDINFKLAGILRKRIRAALKYNIKSGSAIKDLGCTLLELKNHLESLWKPGMTWDNYGPKGWHIDHIKPLSTFILTDKKQFKEACNFRNLQPLWAKDNLSKGNKLEYHNTDVKST